MATRACGRRLFARTRPRLCLQCMWELRPQYMSTSDSPSPSSPPASTPPPPHTPLRKQLKEETKARKRAAAESSPDNDSSSWRRAQTLPGWELTVGIEIHAQLNTAHKLFSAATTTGGETPNTHVAPFDAALPGAQPQFQPAVLIPALRAALALGCAVQPVSRFDRKHYVHWDQPAGYQITQLWEPLARGGQVRVRKRDGAAEPAVVDILQVQLEQDTAKTLAQPGSPPTHWLDLNRAGAPLIEIVGAPQIHQPATAAAYVRKVQQVLRAVDACTVGMEAGGLRADVNVSVRRTGEPRLGTRTEIKNLNSFRAVEDAVLAERNRQIAVLEAGGVVEGETRGWTPGTAGLDGSSTGETHVLRRKAGEVDYRYMPDPDLAPVRIDPALIGHLARTLGVLPDTEIDALVRHHGLTTKDALALTQLDDGGRAQFYYDVVALFEGRLGPAASAEEGIARRASVANWVLHQLGRLTAEGADLEMTPAGRCRIPAASLAVLLALRHQGRITAGVAKELLFGLFRGDFTDVVAAVDAGQLWFREISPEAYAAYARKALANETKTLRPFVRHAVDPVGKFAQYPAGKLQYLTGKLLRLAPAGRTDPQAAEAAMRAAIDEYVEELTGEGE